MLQVKAKTKRKLRNRKATVKRFAVFFILVGLISVGSGYVIAAKPFEQTTKPSIPQKVSANEKIDRSKIIADIKEELRKQDIEATNVDVQNDTYVISLDGGKTVTLSSKKDVSSQISSLQFILSRLTMEGRQFSRLDLRFDKPIIVAK